MNEQLDWSGWLCPAVARPELGAQRVFAGEACIPPSSAGLRRLGVGPRRML